MRGDRERLTEVVEYWRTVELFSPQKVPAVSLREQVYEVAADRALPWEDGHPVRSLPLDPGYTWQHIVYGGCFALADVRDTLLEVFGRDEEDVDGRMDGDTALFALTVTDDGRLLLDSPVFSACGWATGRALSPGPGGGRWLDGFEEDIQPWLARAAGLGEQPVPVVARATAADEPLTGAVLPAADDVDGGAVPQAVSEQGDDQSGTPVGSRRISAEDLIGFTHDLAVSWGVEGVLRPFGLRVRTVAVREDRAEDSDQQGFLNSFIADDLKRVATALPVAGPGAPLEAYLTPDAELNTARRIDLRVRPEAALAGVEPRATPLGRWPAESTHPLALSQQFAVNSIKAELAGGGGLFAVNGPPGTGKTTMLRDSIADLVVERAVRLAGLRLPSAAFSDTVHRWKSGEYTRTVTELLPEFTGFEMVVASANNGAVENISTEIPARDALGAQWREDADYFAEQATRLLKGVPAWGAVAARLGSKKNRIEFVNRFWHGKEKGTDQNAPATADGARPGAWSDSGQGLSQLLRTYATTPQAGVWREAKDRFQTALAEVHRLRDERDAAAAALRAVPAAQAAVEAAQQGATEAAEGLARRWETVSAAEQALAQALQACDSAEDRRREHSSRRPGFWIIVCTLGRAARDWHAEDQILARRERDTQTAQQETDSAARQARTDADRADAELRDRRKSLTRAVEYAQNLDRTVSEARAAWGAHVPQNTWLTDDTTRELAAPWSDQQITQARSELFFAALDLHQAFLRCTAKTMRANLMAAMDVVTGGAPATLGEAARRAAWQSLFLVVPVMSTTFASLDRVFTGIGRGALGWLFIDEAGQATPQMAVGAMWRTQHAVVVGDPLQLEPVVPLPWTAQQALRRDYGVDEEWVPGRTSVQQLADRGNRFGTTLPAELPDGSIEVWVGAPLRVHRRCDDPMFTISNAIAYDGLMVNGTPDRGLYRYRPASSWVDVVSSRAEGHWIPEEGRALRQILERLSTTDGIDPAKHVYVISPFRAVVAGARQVCRGLLPMDRVGTVHTTQGKEADVVILILGTDPARPGARAWAASRPNLLNVAVSRAKRRLFIIGNREAWRDQRHFSTLAAELPHHAWAPAGT
ncbi:hypothetical protein E5083_30060 [Streptomyces bauhiniae]|uniref:DNA helicase n=1 Tax=Streptomyces bauhiniae TaxID=2340725 RepID=A0A4Z1CU01_9ACTN|nr:DEAD/DEAH box helicase [Streptomyces bauhiniae]TGN72337.1 hypothetical protein E5083_30060 [Streptomyces bauhiniae]